VARKWVALLRETRLRGNQGPPWGYQPLEEGSTDLSNPPEPIHFALSHGNLPMNSSEYLPQGVPTGPRDRTLKVCRNGQGRTSENIPEECSRHEPRDGTMGTTVVKWASKTENHQFPSHVAYRQFDFGRCPFEVGGLSRGTRDRPPQISWRHLEPAGKSAPIQGEQFPLQKFLPPP
jgi:hypothetical protein